MLELYHTDNELAARRIIDDNKEHSDILAHLFTKYLAQPVLGNVLETEYEFKEYIPGIEYPLYGFIDRIDEDKGVEYKTTSKKWNDKDVDTIQTDIYMYILYKRFGEPFPLVYSINNKKTNTLPQIIRVEKTEKEILSVEDKIRKYIEDVKSSDFTPTPSGDCYLCPWGSIGDRTCEYSK